MHNPEPYTLDRIIRICIYIFVVAAFIWLVRYLSDALIPFGIAFLIAYLLNPLVNLVEKKVKNRVTAVACTLAGIVLALLLLGFLAGGIVLNQMSDTGELLSNLIRDQEMTERARELFSPTLWDEFRRYISRQNIIGLLQNDSTIGALQVAAKKLLPGVWSIFSGASAILFGIFGLFVIILYLVFLLMDFDRVTNEIDGLIPPPIRDTVVSFLSDLNESMGRYFRAQAYMAMLMGIIFAVGFSLIGLPLAILLGLFVGLLNMIPYLQTIGIIPAGFLVALKCLETGQSFWILFGMMILVFVLAQIIQDGFLTPKIMGKLTGLSPALLMLSLTIWGKLLGFLGLIVAIPLTCLFLTMYRRNMQKYK